MEHPLNLNNCWMDVDRIRDDPGRALGIIASLVAEVQQLRDALRPFAVHIESVWSQEADDQATDIVMCEIGELRRASVLLGLPVRRYKDPTGP